MQRISLSNAKLMNLFYHILSHSISSYSYGNVNIACERRILDQAEGTRLILYTNCNYAYLSNGLFFFERCSPITATVCAYKLNNAPRVSALWKFVYTHRCSYKTTSFKKNNSLLIFTFLKPFLHCILIFLKTLSMPYRLCE